MAPVMVGRQDTHPSYLHLRIVRGTYGEGNRWLTTDERSVPRGPHTEPVWMGEEFEGLSSE